MYAGTIFEIIDRSHIPALPVAEAAYKPLFLCAAPTIKGRENIQVYEGKDFYTNFGSDISFVKYGQPLVQAARIINAGGRVLFKRIVASDALLANTTIIATVKSVEVQKTDGNGELVYIDATTGEETLVAEGNTPVMVSTANISFSSVCETPDMTVEGATPYNIDKIASLAYGANSSYTDPAPDYTTGVSFPLFTITDIGRGVSNKRWRITPNYTSSKSLGIMCYTLEIIENNIITEKFGFTFNPDSRDPYTNAYLDLKTVVDGKSDQIRVRIFNDATLKMYEAVSNIIGTDEFTLEELYDNDIIFGTTRKGDYISNLTYDGIDLASSYGLTLDGGSNGVFKDSPLTAEEELNKQYLEFFNGTTTDEIYDVDTYQLDVIVDANYPDNVKRAIEALAMFREDCVAFIDMGTEIASYEEIVAYGRRLAKSRYCYATFLAYDVIDEYTNRQIRVTAMYDLAPKLVPHFSNGRNRAFAGLKFGVTLDSAIEGTVNFIPKIVPSVNQKELMDDTRINYASYYNGVLTMDTEYTTQEEYTQLSFVNNVFAIQEVIKAIRVRCPHIRYSFLDAEGLKEYQTDVTGIIDRYVNNFMSLSFKYIEDKIMAQNKIYYAAIEVRFKNFVQTEWFKITALPSDL